MNKIVLGVSGSIAAYRACDLARELMRAGHQVRVCLTDAAQNFVTPALFEGLTGQPTLIDTFEEPERGRMAHIDWARNADLIIVAPATANTINKLATGQGDDMLTTIALATDKPIIIAPAMNPTMYQHPATQISLNALRSRGHVIVEPTEGEVACGENGQGKLAANSSILQACQAVLLRSKALHGKKVVITSGPTQESIDDVRFLSNRSSGKMGMALARAAKLMGAEVTLVSGPTSLPDPTDIHLVKVKTALEMLDAAEVAAQTADFIVGAAAVADYRPAEPISGKMRRSEGELTIRLIQNPDIIATLANKCPSATTIAFAAEPSSDTSYAEQKLKAKKVAAIAFNDVSNQQIGFESDENEITLIFADGKSVASGRQSKLMCAFWFWESVARRSTPSD
ncbi:bifunctional phosphopantothenoylcysteine decarboxylase/phosphopantothenate--cysteine ligase CoaBC [Kamptonema cortianum]|nr:bifunctional phosphopantothenoylcysteine decarboxylase/phosphopantothenate--cysteine ligase CoaBC [Geitlerinema splendidum]MDK3157059.1 bifunctional phosphopantothenoylcysteine decarboxylase/phosphopantothenate--cysteine ligase CoaBC [Kamptonema cortianum]